MNNENIEDNLDLFNDPGMMNIFMELHSGNPREGPGDDASTVRALRSIPSLPERPEILDIGCGPGMQTLILTEITRGNITALDFFPQFLEQLRVSAVERDVGERITTVQGDMNALPFDPETFDLIWSEGAIYIMGFENGLKQWKKFLRPGGAIAVSQISWLREDIPNELFNWWMENCPDIRQVRDNLEIIEKCGYNVIDHFTLPESAWWENYYQNLENRMDEIRKKYPDDEKALMVLEMEEEEQRMYSKYSSYYGYEFYVMKKV